MERLDVLLFKKNLCESRSLAQRLIEGGKVAVNQEVVTKCSQKFDSDVSIEIEKDAVKYVSRGGLKLEKALEVFEIDLNGKIVLDIGSSTGGFCDCALKFGASQVLAVDVGVNQLHESLKKDRRVLVFEGVDIRDFTIPCGFEPQILVGDLSFISLAKILPHISNFSSVEIFCLLVKPQFECGIEVARKHKGVIKDLNVHKNVLNNVWCEFEKNNLIVQNLTISPICGGDGNVEYLIYAKQKSKNAIKLNEVQKAKIIGNMLEFAKQKIKG